MMDLQAFNQLSYGLYVVSTYDEVNRRPTGCVLNSVVQTTAIPATVAISVSHENHTHQCIVRHRRFGISTLPEGVNPRVIGCFGFQSGRDLDKFSVIEGVERDGIMLVAQACGYLTLELIDSLEAPTHTIFLGNVIGCGVFNESTPMTYDYYHRVVKGKTPKNAATFRPAQTG